MSGKILVVEDDPQLSSYIAGGLAEQGYFVECADNGRDGLFLALEGQFGAIILDRMLPAMDGLSLLKAIRGAGLKTPVIVLSALGSTDERVLGLSSGADDYLTKPFAFSELLARLQAILRRGGNPQDIKPVLQYGDLELDRLARVVKRGGRKVALQPREFQLLEYLMTHSGELVTRTMLLEAVWDYHFDPVTNVIDVHVSRLRRKLEEEGEAPLIETVRGAGYRLGSR